MENHPTGSDCLSPEQHIEQQGIIQRLDASAACKFAIDHPNADIKALQSLLLDSSDFDSIITFAAEVKGADIPVIQRIVLAFGLPSDVMSFACRVTGADIDACQHIILHDGDPDDVYSFAANVEGADIKKLQYRLLDLIEDFGTMYARLFAQNVPGCNLQLLQGVVLKCNDAMQVYMFARDVPGASVQALYHHATRLKFEGLNQEQIDYFERIYKLANMT